MRRSVLLSGLTTLALAAAGLAAVATPSSAEVIHHGHLYVHRDPHGDVVRWEGGDPAEPVPARGRKQGDITRVRARYGRHNLTLSFYFRRLDRPQRGEIEQNQVTIQRPGLFVYLADDATTSHPHGTSLFLESAGSHQRCSPADTVNYVRRRVELRVPAHCLGAAPWVRVTFESIDQGTSKHPRPVYYDDGILRSDPVSTPSDLSPRIYR